MIKVIIKDHNPIYPFYEKADPDQQTDPKPLCARDLTILNKRLWLLHRDILRNYCNEEFEYDHEDEIEDTEGETLVYRDNLFFDEDLIDAFLKKARQENIPCQIAFSKDDAAITHHALSLQSGIREQGGVYLADLYYYPRGYNQLQQKQLQPVVIDTQAEELGYYNVPEYMAEYRGELVYYVPRRPFLSIENWAHIFLANTAFGLFSRGKKIESRLGTDIPFMLNVFWSALLERKQLLESSPLVQVGKNCQIDPAATIQGPTVIGDNVTIGPGAVINTCLIGDNVNISQGCQLMLSVVGSGTFLPFRASLFMTTLMEKGMVAQNTCLQMCVIGRETFIGAGNTFTDFNIKNRPIRTLHRGQLVNVEQPVIGGCVGNYSRIGSGHILFPARIIGSNVILCAQNDRLIIEGNIDQSD